MSRGNQGLLIGQGDINSCLNRGNGRLNPDHSDDRCYNNISSGKSGSLIQPVHTAKNGNPGSVQTLPQLLPLRFTIYRNRLRVKFQSLGCKQINVGACCQSDNLKLRIITYDFQSLCTDRPCRTKYGNIFHVI